MTYKETLFFVAKCLTISLEEKNRKEIELTLKTTTIDWDSVVKVSTAQYVFPALYCTLKRVGFLHYVPADLVAYMKHITDLNRERNQQIIAQAKEVNDLLLTNNITAIFLKGTGNLLEGLYEDIGERMVGDIDLLFKKDEVNLAYKTLKKNNYKENGGSSEMIPNHRHFRRLVNKKNIAALEIHKEILRDTYSKQFNYNSLESNLKLEQGFWVPNFKHQLVLTILSKQINDNGYQLKSVYLRSLYDVFLFSKKTNSLNAIQDFPYFFFQTNSFLALTSVVLNHPISIKYEDNKTVKNYVNSSLNNLKSKKRLIRCQIFLKHRIPVFLKAFYKKDYRRFLLSRIKARPNA